MTKIFQIQINWLNTENYEEPSKYRKKKKQ